MNNPDHLKAIAEKMNEAWNRHDAQAISVFFAEDVLYYLEGQKEPIRGRDTITMMNQAFFQAFPDVSMKFTNIFAEKDHFIAEGITVGTHTGPFVTPEGAIDPTGKAIEIAFVFIAEFNEEGLIIEDRTYSRSEGLMIQLGLG